MMDNPYASLYAISRTVSALQNSWNILHTTLGHSSTLAIEWPWLNAKRINFEEWPQNTKAYGNPHGHPLKQMGNGKLMKATGIHGNPWESMGTYKDPRKPTGIQRNPQQPTGTHRTGTHDNVEGGPCPNNSVLEPTREPIGTDTNAREPTGTHRNPPHR